MNEQETIADIIAEMRIFKCRNLNTDQLELCTAIANYFADRLDTAHKRERGDCAKLREALENVAKQLTDATEDENFGEDVMYLVGCMRTMSQKCRTVLAAPPRNCDVGTVMEQFARFRKFCKKDSMDSFAATAYCAYECPCGNSYDCKLAWAQMPYEEGGAK